MCTKDETECVIVVSPSLYTFLSFYHFFLVHVVYYILVQLVLPFFIAVFGTFLLFLPHTARYYLSFLLLLIYLFDCFLVLSYLPRTPFFFFNQIFLLHLSSFLFTPFITSPLEGNSKWPPYILMNGGVARGFVRPNW